MSWALAVPLLLLALLAAPASAQPQSAAAPTLRFDVERYQVEGNTLLEPRVIERTVAPYIGKSKDFSDIQRALAALEVAYRDRGYGTVQVILPEQNIGTGVVLFKIVEPQLARVTIEGAERSDAANIRRSIPALREGSTPNSTQIARNLMLANENPARSATVLLRADEQAEDKVEATIKVVEDKPWKASFTLDNTGTDATGDYRMSVGFQHANMFNLDHVLTMQYITSPDHMGDVKVYGLGYRIPFYNLGGSLEAVVGYSSANNGVVQDLFTVSGSGTIAGLRYNQYLPKLGSYEQRLVYGLDYKAFQNQVITAGESVVPDITVHPANLTYYGTFRREDGETGFYLSYSQNIPGGSDGTDSDFKASRVDARAAFRVYRYGAHFLRALPADWQLRAVLTGQYTPDALVTGEQFGIGGAENLRGFGEREVANDRGYRANVEVYTPNFAAQLGWRDVQSRLLAFYDWGTVSRNSPQPGESLGQSLAAAGLGLRLTAGKYFSMRSDYAYVLDGGGTRDKGHTRVHASFSLVY